ncbi:MAG: SPFH/Band 7/PHB domain protein [Clostridium sp.]|nr:SPFH/Band 7/PHB domain protein [Clostridium sp.]
MSLVVLGIVVLVILVFLILCLKVVSTGNLYVVERFGEYNRTLEPGWHIMIPFIDYVRRKVSMKIAYLDIEPQSVITKDNVKISIDNVCSYVVNNARDAVYNIENFKTGIVYSAIIQMRNAVGSMNLDEILSKRQEINKEILRNVEEVTTKFGVEILSVEIKNIIPPEDIRISMETQMKAEREKRAKILEAEGSRQSEITKAEGGKQAKILQAEAEKEANIRRAEGSKQSQLLEAEGKAMAIQAIAEAEAAAILKVNKSILDSGTNETIIALKQVDALKEMAKNPANKLILPNETLSSLGSIAAVGELLKK